MKKNSQSNNRLINLRRLFFILLSLGYFLPVFAHETPTTVVLLDVSPKIVTMELQLPLSELSLALGQNLGENTETLIEKQGSILKNYILEHTKIYVTKDKPWSISISEMYVDNGEHEVHGVAFKELRMNFTVTPNDGENTRQFTLDYDAIMHQVGNHAAFVSIRNDWELGTVQNTATEMGIIKVDTKDNRIYPLNISLQKGSWFKGFSGMFFHGIQHIKEGTDHLLFILTLLLPACLLVVHRKWTGYGGLKYSLLKLLKIVTAFTIGHSITLLIGVFEICTFPIQIIEILIAVSILVSAIHAIKPIFYQKETFIAIGFGLIHGLAFSQTLQNLHLSTSELLLSVAGFNLGIEAMQLFAIAIIVPSFMIMSQTTYFNYVKNILATAVIVISVGWVMERINNTPNVLTTATNLVFEHTLYLIIGLYVTALFIYFLEKNKENVIGR
jgi:hypothetical protein